MYFLCLEGVNKMKSKDINKELVCKIKVVVNKTTGTKAITAQCTSRNEVLIAIGY